MGTVLRLGPDGYFTREGKRFIPVGANYWPGSCGVELWPRFPEDEIARDLDVLRGLGLNSLRFFLRWQDFEPRAGEYDAATFQRLRRFLQLCRERGIYAQPSLVVGFMSGGTFWPQWRQGRNVFADEFMRHRAAAYATKVAEAIVEFRDTLLGIDQGNELCCLADSREAGADNVAAWCEAFNAGIRHAWPDCLIVSGNEQNQIVNDVGWRLDNQRGCDYLSMHGYPVPGWHSIGFDGMTDPLCQSLLPLYVKVARTYGPVMLQEFGTIATFGARQQDAYLRAMLPAAWEAGANGFLWWCLRDIAAPVFPYTKNNFESTLGLVDEQGKVKPGLEYFVEFARTALPSLAGPASNVGIYWPKHYYPAPANPGNSPQDLSRQIVIANYMLQRLKHSTRIIRGDVGIPGDLRTLVIPGAVIDATEAAALVDWVRGGGRLLWHGPDMYTWGQAQAELLGATAVDYRSGRARTIDFAGQSWQLSHFPRNVCVEAQPITAKTLTTIDSLPMVLSHDLGAGRVVWSLAQIEKTIAAVADQRQLRDRWLGWYEGMSGILNA